MGSLFPIIVWVSYLIVPAASLQNTTDIHIRKGLVPEPGGRGTISIIYSSIITLSLCAYTAIHLNVNSELRGVAVFIRKARMVFMGLVLPEVVLVQAYRDWVMARQLHKDWCEFFHIEEPGGEIDRLRLEGAFFVVMGGYSVRSGGSKSALPTILTPKGFMAMIEDGSIDPESIDWRQVRDKGKADGLGKALVCCQASWMLIQCAVRKLCHLPITLIELHAILHILCAAAMYFFWWKKPLDVGEPIIVIDDPTLGMILSVACDNYREFRIEIIPSSAGLLPTERTGIEDSSQSPLVLSWIDGEIENVIFYGHSGSSPIPWGPLRQLDANRYMGTFIGGKDQFRVSKRLQKGNFAVFRGERLVCENNFAIRCDSTTMYRRNFLTAKDLQSLLLVASDARDGKYSNYFEHTPSAIKFNKPYTHALTLPPLNIYGFSMPRWKSVIWPAASQHHMFIPLAILYGARHATAWNSYFPTPLERWFWRVGCIVIAITPLTIFVYTKLTRRLIVRQGSVSLEPGAPALDGPSYKPFSWEAFPVSDIHEIGGGVFGLITCALFMTLLYLYLAVRLFMTTEAFIGLRAMPQGVFETVKWEGYWPHAG